MPQSKRLSASYESPCYTMFRDSAAEDRTINMFPRPYKLSATPYLDPDFDPKVKQGCTLDKNIQTSGLRISKVIVVGDVAVGKTCLVNRFCHKIFDCNYKATIGVDFEVERFDILDTPFNLQLWDTAGQEKFQCIASAYYRRAQVIILVFDLSSLFSLHNVPKWLDATMKSNDESPLLFLVGTKMDLICHSPYIVVEKEALDLAAAINAEYWPISSKTGENVNKFFYRVAALAFSKAVTDELEVGPYKPITSDFVKLANQKKAQESKSRNKNCVSACKR